MGGRRTTPPLFELLGESDADRAQRAGARIEPKPSRPAPKQPKPRPDPAPIPEKREKADRKAKAKKTTEREPWSLDAAKRVSIPLNAILIGVAILLAAGVFGVSIAWQIGMKGGQAEKQRLLDQLAPGEDAVRDPLVENLPVNGELLATPPAEQTTPPAVTPTRRGSFVVDGGFMSVDPRQSGFNYLKIAGSAAKIDQAEAARIAAFFASSGLEVVCVPVDSGGRAPNNGSYYEVFVLQGVPGDQFSARKQERQDLERRVAQLGEIWQREHKGTTDFADTLWTKHKN